MRGHVTFIGTVPEAQPIEVTKDAARCGKQVEEGVKLGLDHGVQNAVVFIEDLPAPSEPLDPDAAPVQLKIEDKHCRLSPRVSMAQTGATLELSNLDPLFHSLTGIVDGKVAFKAALALEGQKRVVDLTQPARIEVRCSVHPWETAWTYVFAHPYFTMTESDGSYRIQHLPDGVHTVVAWHEKLGMKRAQVAVTTFITVADFEMEGAEQPASSGPRPTPAQPRPVKRRRHK